MGEGWGSARVLARSREGGGKGREGKRLTN